MKRILLPVDGSEASGRAVEHVIDMLLLIPPQSRPALHVANVQQALIPNFNIVVREQDKARYYEEAGRPVVDAVDARLNQENIEHTLHILIGAEISGVIADFANQHHCDLIIMGTRGLGTIKGMVLGSVATKVVHQANCPVLLVK